MKKFGKRSIAATLVFASLLAHNPKSLALTEGQKSLVCTVGILVGSIATAASAGYLFLGGYKGHFDLSEKGKRFISNPISEIDVKNISKETLCQYLREICESVGVVKGVDLDSGKKEWEEKENQDGGWVQSAWEYIFVKNYSYAHSDMYDDKGVSDYHRQILAKCILIMYQNRDNKTWSDVIRNNIVQLSSHGGHCDWRFVTSIYSLYRNLLQFAHDIGTIKSGSDIDPMDREFASFKEAMIGELTPIALEYIKNLRKIINGVEDENPEYLDSVNKATLGFEYLVGIPVDEVPCDALNYGKMAFNEMMKLENLVKVSDKMIKALDDTRQKELFDLMNKASISFKEYCKYTMKPKEQIKNIVSKIEEDNDEQFKEWVQGKRELGAYEITSGMISGLYNDKGLDLNYPYGVAWVICCIKKGYLVPKGHLIFV